MKNLFKIVCAAILSFSLIGCSTINDFVEEYKESKEDEKVNNKEYKPTKKSEDKKETKEDKKEEDTTVYEIEIMDLLNNADYYEGKHVRVQGILPEGQIEDADGNLKTGLLNEDSTKFVEITGTMPNIGNCRAWVIGTINKVKGEIVINATNYELIEQFEVAKKDDTQKTEQKPAYQAPSYNYYDDEPTSTDTPADTPAEKPAETPTETPTEIPDILHPDHDHNHDDEDE